MRVGLPLMKNVLTLLAKDVLVPSRLTAAASATDTTNQKKINVLMTALIVTYGKMEDIVKIVKSLEELDLLMKVAGETTENEAKEQKGGFLVVLLGLLAGSVLRNMLLSKAKKTGLEVIRAGEGTLRTSHDF